MADLQYPLVRNGQKSVHSEQKAPFADYGVQRRSLGAGSQRLSAGGPLSSRFQERLSTSRGRDEISGQEAETPSAHWSTSSYEPTSAGNTASQRFSDREDENLTELAAPDLGPRLRAGVQAYLESQGGGHEPTELTAPPPVQRDNQQGQWPGSEHLESQRHNKLLNQEPPDPKDSYSEVLTQFYIVCNLIFFSILGTLARLGTQWLGFYPGAITTTSNLWANFGGSFFMGFLTEDRQLFQEEWGQPRSWHGDQDEIRKAHKAAKKTIPLFVGLTVGFCGSYTSFSTFMRDVFLALSNDVAVPRYYPAPDYSPDRIVGRPDGYSFNAVMAIVILQVIVNIGALKFGAHVAEALDGHTPTIPFRFIRTILEPLTVFLGIGCWIGAIVMAAIPPDRPGGPLGHGSWELETWRGQVLFALVFSPLGCILRWFLSIKLNGVIPSFPLGTFTANIFGTAVFAFIYDLQHAPLLLGATGLSKMVGGGRVGCQVMQGVLDGFCGCLTTVSTWVVELSTLKLSHSYIYGSASVLTGLVLVVAIMGGVRWTVGFWDLVCVVENS